jgi:alpha-amylase/alpha-mannosidase (GH57 family)
MAEVRLVVHGHFYQPPRENPWTEEVAAEPSAAPFHDWNERITAECYRPNGWARVVAEGGQVEGIVNNYASLSFDVGPTLLSWMEVHAPDVYRRMLDGDREGGGAIAQAYNHMILPLANERDIRTQVRWGLTEFAHRFGRQANGMWLPETAVNDAVLAVLAEEGVGFTILAPNQAVRVRALDRVTDDSAWDDVSDGSIVGGHPFRWRHPGEADLGVDIVFYDGAISHDLAFGLTGLSSQELVRRVIDAGADGSPVCVATDGETFGHHHKFADRALAFAFATEAPARGVRVLNARDLVTETSPTHEVAVRESAWSCAHGVGRWKEDCGCHTGGEPGWNQRWRAPLRSALDLLRDAGIEIAERRGPELFRDVWGARDAYIDVLLGRRSVDDFLGEHGAGAGARGPEADPRQAAMTLMEAQRHAMLMYTSCGWFFNDLAGLETVQVLRYAARTMDLLTELGERPPVAEFLETLAGAESNRRESGTGADIWRTDVDPSRVDADRVTGHLALADLLQPDAAPTTLAGFDVEAHDHDQRRHGSVTVVAGRVTLVHRRTGRRADRVYAAAHFQGLDVTGAVRTPDEGRDAAARAALLTAVEDGARVSTILRLVDEGFGPREFGLDSALPDAADQIVRGIAERLSDRVTSAMERLYEDNRPTIDALVTAGYPLPPELRAPAELALARRFDDEIAAVADPTNADPSAFGNARDVVRAARAAGLRLATPRAAAVMTRSVTAVVDRAVADPTATNVGSALDLLRLTRDLDLEIDVTPAQERVFAALHDGGDAPGVGALRELGRALHLAV